jgi:hypothetical protein
MVNRQVTKCETFEDFLVLNNLRKVRILGVGEFGRVFLVEKGRNEFYAVKIMSVSKFNPQEWELTKLLRGFVIVIIVSFLMLQEK